MSSNFNGAQVGIIEESGETPTGGHFFADNLEFSLPSQAAGTKTDTAFSWPFPFAPLALQVDVGPEHVGDRVSVAIAPDAIVGAITVAAAINDKVFDVAQSVIDNVVVGELADIDGQPLGFILDVDTDGLQITTETAATATIAIGGVVKKTRLMGRNIKLQASGVSKCIGGSKIGASYLPANTDFVITYENGDGAAKDVAFCVEGLF